MTVIILASCNNSDKIRDILKAMQSQPVRIEYSNMLCIRKDTISQQSNVHAPYRLVIYSSQDDCLTCAINNLSDWNALQNLEEQGKVEFIFIFAPKMTDFKRIVNTYYSSKLEHPILIDTCENFSKMNPQIPKERLFHTFLLDSNDSVILVGDPLRSEEISEMMNRIIKSNK